jgi:hypothetical protein
MFSLRTCAVFILALAGAAVTAVPLHAQDELLVPKVIKRPFPQGVYCPLPFDMVFTANATSAVLRISTTTVNFSDDNNNGDPAWSDQRLDNICVSPDKAYNANLGTYLYDCYYPHPEARLTSVFEFQNAGALPLKETFTSDPAVSGWDVTHGAYWNPTSTAPNDPDNDQSLTPTGALGLGAFDPAFSLTDSAYTTKSVTGLTKGSVYHVTGWWYVGGMNLEKILLTVVVLGPNATPIARSSWGMLKRKYQ